MYVDQYNQNNLTVKPSNLKICIKRNTIISITFQFNLLHLGSTIKDNTYLTYLILTLLWTLYTINMHVTFLFLQ